MTQYGICVNKIIQLTTLYKIESKTFIYLLYKIIMFCMYIRLDYKTNVKSEEPRFNKKFYFIFSIEKCNSIWFFVNLI